MTAPTMIAPARTPSASTPAQMRLGVSTLGADGGRSGIGRYVVELLREFTTLRDAVDLDVIATRDEFDAFPGADVSSRFAPRMAGNPLLGLAWHQSGLPRRCRTERHDVLFLPAANRRGVLRAPVPTVGTVHDFSSLHVRGKYDRAREFYITRVLPALVRRLDHVITPSEATKRDVVEYAGVEPSRITVVPNGVDTSVFRPDGSDEARAGVRSFLGFDEPYLLYVSRLEHPGKNHVRLIEAFDALRRERGIPHKLVLAGSDWTRADEIHRAAEAASSREHILRMGFVPDGLLPELTREAAMVVFPSLYEGFGIPVLEAMAVGTPVAASNVSSLPEVGGDAVSYFDPSEPASIAESIWGVLAHPSHAADLAARGLVRAREFTWKRTARETLAVLMNQAGRES